MSKYIIDSSTLTAIMDAYREKMGTTDLITPEELPALILAITGGDILTGSATITNNGTYDVSEYKTAVIEVNQSTTLPTMNTPTIARSGDTITITNVSNNGNFMKYLRLYNDLTVVKTQTFSSSSSSSSTTQSIKALTPGKYVLYAAAGSTYFNESSKSSSITCYCYSITNTLTDLTSSNNNTTIADGQSYSATLTPSKGYWLPRTIVFLVNDTEITSGYTYDMYTGKITYTAKTDTAYGDFEIQAVADDEPYLATPEIAVAEYNVDDTTRVLTIEEVKYAQYYDIYLDDELICTEEYVEPTVTFDVSTASGATYGFSLDSSTGYYVPGNKGVSSSYALSVVTITADADTSINFIYQQSSEQNYDYGLVSTLDNTLSASATADSSNVLLNCYGKTYTTDQTLSIDITAGTHTLYVKYRKDGSGNSGSDQFKFKLQAGGSSNLASKVATPTISSALTTSGLSIILSNDDYDNNNTYNITWEVYLSDELIYEEKEGI